MVLLALLLVLSCCSLFVGVINLTPAELLAGNFDQIEIFLISRLPRLLAILCTGVGMSVAGLIMQQLCSNKFVSPTTGATISSAQFGILLALLFRSAGVALCMLGTDLNKKERTFCVIAYLPKATVQAAIGSVPLSMGLSCGKIVLSVAVLAILITAPLGALGMDATYRKLLQKNGENNII